VALRVDNEWFQRGDLCFRLQYGLMCTIQIVKVRNQSFNPRLNGERLEHVSADEVCEVSNGFHRNRLVKQLQCLFALDAESPPKCRTVRRKRVV
jgi:hypothetical protein